MSKHSLSSRTLLRGISLVAVILSIFIIARVLLVYMPPLVFSVSPKVFRPGERVVVRGIMGGKSKRDATQLFLNGVPITDESVEKHGFFFMRIRFTQQNIENIIENRGALIALVYKKYRSGETIISLANGSPKENSAVQSSAAADASITLRSFGVLYPDTTLVFEVNFARSEVVSELSAASNLGYFFEIQPRRGDAYRVLPSQQMLRVVDGKAFISFPVPVSLFPRPPYAEESAAVRVFRGDTQAVAEYFIPLAMRAVLSSPPAIFAVNASYNIGTIEENAGGDISGGMADANEPPPEEPPTMMTALIPPERPWQLVSAENSDGTAPVQFDAVRGIIKAESPLKVTFVLTRYPFMDIEWNTIDAASERKYFANALRHDAAAATAFSAQNTAEFALPSLPAYFADAQYYIGDVELALGAPAPRVRPPSGGTLQSLITYYSERARQMVQQGSQDAAGENSQENTGAAQTASATAAASEPAATNLPSNLPTDAGTRTILFAEEVLQNFVGTQGFSGAAALRVQLMELILIAANLRENGIPAQVMLGFAHESESNKLLPAYPAVWLEVFTSRYGIIPLAFQNDAEAANAQAGEGAATAPASDENRAMTIPDNSYIGLAVFEQLRFLDYLRQNPAFLSDISSIKLRE